MFIKHKALWGLFAGLALPVLALPTPPRNAVPGTLNYLEGQVTLDGNPINSNSNGVVHADPNSLVETGRGKAEMLLTPGVFLRVGNDSSVRMVSPNLDDTQVELLRGEAVVEADEVFPENHILVLSGGTSTEIVKQGLYAFNADARQVRVFDGEAIVAQGDRHVKAKKGREVALNSTLQEQKFNRDKAQDPLYGWSQLRSEYEAQANASSVTTIIDGGPGWYGPGWYWNPWWDMYSFIPGAGIAYSPFGWGFYSPWVYPGYGYGFARGYSHGGRIGLRGSGLRARGLSSGGFSRGFAGAPRMGGGHMGGGGMGGHVGGGRR